MLKIASKFIPVLDKMNYKQGWDYLSSQMNDQNKIFISSLMMNLDRGSKDNARFLMNVEALSNPNIQREMFDFPLFDDFKPSQLSAK